MEPVNGINKDMCGAKLLSTTVSAYPVDCVRFCDLLKTQHCCLSSNGRYNLTYRVLLAIVGLAKIK